MIQHPATSTEIESALVVLIPEADGLIETFRKRYDPSAEIIFPAHVTILYPFKPPDQLTMHVITTLKGIFDKIPSFTASFPELNQFPDMLYLAPKPGGPFKQIIETIVQHFPETPPYHGEFQEIVPHLTIAQISDPMKLKAIAADFQQTAGEQLPIHARVDTVTLMDNSSGHWETRTKFRLQSEERK